MEQKTKSPQFLRRRKFFTILPLLLLPFTTLLFWSMGGGQAGAEVLPTVKQKGLNDQLPDARLSSNTALDKMSYYDHAASDSAKLREQQKSDPFYAQLGTTPDGKLNPAAKSRTTPAYSTGYPDPNEEKVYKKLEQLNAALATPPKTVPQTNIPGMPADNTPASPGVSSQDIDRLQQMMKTMQSDDSEDPEMKQLGDLLEKIQQVQHPELLKSKLTAVDQPNVALPYQTIPAAVAENQKVTQGTVIKLRLLDTLRLNGQIIPKGHLIYGSCAISNQRLTLHIKQIRMGYSLIPVDLTVFDMNDSMEGINVPEAITDDAIRSGSDNAIQGLQVLPMDQTMTTQLAGAGISAAKGLFTKKVKRLKAKLKAGYPVLLKNNQQK